MCELRVRYRLAVRSQWWEDEIQVEALAALAAWTERYDSGEWDDPPGKLALLFDIERVAGAAARRHRPVPSRPRPDGVRAPSHRPRLPAAAERTAGGMTMSATIRAKWSLYKLNDRRRFPWAPR